MLLISKTFALPTLGDKSLLELAFQSAMEGQLLTRTILSSDDDEIINEGKRCGCEVLFKRPRKLASDTSSVFSVLSHVVSWLNKKEKWRPDILVILQPTTPFRKGSHIDGVLDVLDVVNLVNTALTGGYSEPGDINQDGILNVLDIVQIINMILSNEYYEIADVNEDGFINILDVVIMANILIGGLP